MDEIVKAINTAFQLLITVCVIVLFVALSARPAARFEAALEEVTKLSELDTREYELSCARQMWLARADVTDAWQQFIQNEIVPGPDFRIVELYVIPPWPAENARLSQIVTLLDSRDQCSVLTLNPVEFIGALREERKVWAPWVRPVVREIGVEQLAVAPQSTEMPGSEFFGRQIENHPVFPSGATVDRVTRFAVLSPDETTTYMKGSTEPGALVNVSYTAEGGSPINPSKLEVRKARLEGVRGFYARNWLRSRQDALVAVADGRTYSLPNCRDIWDQVEAKTLVQAESFLRQQMAASTRSVMIMGVSIEEQALATMAPLLVVPMLVYLFVYVNQLRRLTEKEKLSPYWIGFFPDLASRAIVTGGILALPIIVLFLVTVRFGGQWNHLASAAFIPLAAVVSLRTVSTLSELQQKANLAEAEDEKPQP